MRQIFHFASTESIFQRACELRDFDPKPDDYFYESASSERMTNTWRAWYYVNTEHGFKDGELEQAVAEALEIPVPARNGFAVNEHDGETFIIADLEECGICDLNDQSDAHLVLPVTQFREWLYNWNRDPLNKVMDTQEAAAFWSYSSADAVKRLCREGKVRCRKLTNGTYIIDRNQPSPKQVR